VSRTGPTAPDADQINQRGPGGRRMGVSKPQSLVSDEFDKLNQRCETATAGRHGGLRSGRGAWRIAPADGAWGIG